MLEDATNSNLYWIHEQSGSTSVNKLDSSSSELIKAFETHSHEVSLLCNALEGFADKLPDGFDNQEALVLARSILPILARAHKFEEQQLFPFISSKYSTKPFLKQSLERLQYEHWQDEAFADEICECLLTIVQTRCVDCADKLSYMLRGFFEGLRRHLAFEQEHLVQMLAA